MKAAKDASAVVLERDREVESVSKSCKYEAPKTTRRQMLLTVLAPTFRNTSGGFRAGDSSKAYVIAEFSHHSYYEACHARHFPRFGKRAPRLEPTGSKYQYLRTLVPNAIKSMA